MTSRQGLQALLTAVGVVATAAGASGVLRGVAEVPRAGPVGAGVDSEHRFYAAWYLVMGPLALRAAREPERSGAVVAAIGAGYGTAGLSRLLSRRTHGRPPRRYEVLTVVELVLTVLVSWQRRVARTGR